MCWRVGKSNKVGVAALGWCVAYLRELRFLNILRDGCICVCVCVSHHTNHREGGGGCGGQQPCSTYERGKDIILLCFVNDCNAKEQQEM